jgi:hypothetical protein
MSTETPPPIHGFDNDEELKEHLEEEKENFVKEQDSTTNNPKCEKFEIID